MNLSNSYIESEDFQMFVGHDIIGTPTISNQKFFVHGGTLFGPSVVSKGIFDTESFMQHFSINTEIDLTNADLTSMTFANSTKILIFPNTNYLLLPNGYIHQN